MQTLSSEVIEQIISSCLDRTSEQNQRQLFTLQRVCSNFIIPARRLIYRSIHIKTRATAIGLLEALKTGLGSHVRYLTIDHSVYNEEMDSTLHSDNYLIELLKTTPNLISFITPFSITESNSNSTPGNTSSSSSTSNSIYPNSLDTFQCATGLKDVAISDEEDEIDSDDSEEDQDGKEIDAILKQEESKRMNYIPTVLRKLYDVPSTVTSLFLRGGLNLSVHQSLLENEITTPTRNFPLQNLKALEIVQSRISEEIFRWIITPSVNAKTLKRLKLWSVSGITEDQLLPIVEELGSQLEDFMYRSGISTGTNFTNRAVAALPSLKMLTLGPHSSSKEVYSHISSPSITHLCIAIPNHCEVGLNDLIKRLTKSNLRQVRRFELYSQLYFPPPVEIEVLDDRCDSNSNDSTQLRELRLSHVIAKPDHLNRLFKAVGSHLKILALHHVNKCFTDMISRCPNLLRLELGVDSYHNGEPHEFNFKFLSLHLLRIHFASGVELSDVIKGVLDPNGLPSLKTIDIGGLFPEQVPTTWTGKLLGQLLEVCQTKGIEFCINGRGVQSTSDLWSALLEHFRYQR